MVLYRQAFGVQPHWLLLLHVHIASLPHTAFEPEP